MTRISGRNCYGRITVRRRGGGHKRRYRIIDFRRDKYVPARVESVEYDPNRSARIALLCYAIGERRYILAPKGSMLVMKSCPTERLISSRAIVFLSEHSCGTMSTRSELIGAGAKLCRAAGTAQLLAKEGDWAQIHLPSSEVRLIHLNCRATIGQVGNEEHGNIKIGKAGRARWLGRRPKVRGVAMNPVDHPHGGGEEGRTSGGRHPVSPWGMPTKGKRTRNNQRTDRFIVRRRGKQVGESRMTRSIKRVHSSTIFGVSGDNE